MTITLFDVVDRDEYDAAVAARYIKVQAHPTLPYLIHNYTDAATWDRAWNATIKACRGLITDADSGEIIARPYAKFHNVDEPEAPQLALDETVVVMDKADGSLGVLYRGIDGEPLIATRGSFTSDQAQWATQHFQATYADSFSPNPDWTYLFEIVADWNRIVLTYDFEGLILLGAVDIATGATVPLDQAAIGWPGRVVTVFPYQTLADALAAPDRVNAEGFVIWSPTRDERVKIKQEDYKRLHKLLTGVNARHVWEVLAAGDDPAVVFADAPDEWHEWVRTVVVELQSQFDDIDARARAGHAQVLAALPDGWQRRDYALLASQHELRALLFLLLDERSLDESIWKLVRPAGDSTFKAVSADTD